MRGQDSLRFDGGTDGFYMQLRLLQLMISSDTDSNCKKCYVPALLVDANNLLALCKVDIVVNGCCVIR